MTSEAHVVTAELYAQWLEHVFDHPVVPEEWFWALDAPDFAADDDTVTRLVTQTMRRCGIDLVRFSDEQVAAGLKYLFNNSCSNIVFAVMDGPSDIEAKVDAIRSLERLYDGCFERRCAPALWGGSALNTVCYMFWDASPLNYWQGRPGADAAHEACLDVMAHALGSSNIACIQSGLHGLGHMQYRFPDRVARIIDGFIARTAVSNEELLRYAVDASRGRVQ